MRIGIAGAGFMAETHLTAYAEMEVEVVSVAAPSDPRRFIEGHGLDATPYEDVASMCTSEEIDVLDVCTPTHTHVDLVRCAVEADAAVFVEKPIANTLDGAREIADAVERADLTFMAGHVLRFFPEYATAAELDIGTPGVARARRLSPFPEWGSEDWFADREKSGGIFVDLAIHDLDYLRWCWGEVERVFARRHREPRAEHGFVTLRFEGGAVGYVEASWAQPESRAFTSELELAGNAGLVEFSTDGDSPYRQWTDAGELIESPHAKGGYRRELEHFVSCVESGTDPAVGVREATEVLRLALAAERSADRGRPVTVSEVVA
jgi:UDP-N-acetylglucosamine 3-dehydrogenase